ncbi:hypothetical protein [Pararhodospirillum photometricum]|uniref:Uncharacterized protein n=1 Tax=Pararhodospirillum photometricum DSM 122 TaxID=1150469 RepID=H6SML5_PARPM|nr:hypothetical protein [Pararhodospirillum photometricum]CCG09150.1 unnamed protein product [Pararhodospirillum photometricum DSM 122]
MIDICDRICDALCADGATDELAAEAVDEIRALRAVNADMLATLEEVAALEAHTRSGGASLQDLEEIDNALQEAIMIAAAVIAKLEGGE